MCCFILQANFSWSAFFSDSESSVDNVEKFIELLPLYSIANLFLFMRRYIRNILPYSFNTKRKDNKNEKSSDKWEKKLGSGSVFSDRMNKVIKTFNNQLHNILDTCGAIGLF